MTLRLYYTQSYLAEFEAAVLQQGAIEGRNAVVLDRTAFYPTSGGQPHDTGLLGSARVLDVQEQSDGSILHITDAAVPVGTLLGRIDWKRRFDHMQQHSGQHILSQAFIQTAGARTLSFHLGEQVSTIDLDLAHPTPDIMSAAEDLASGIVFEDRPVQVLEVGPGDLAALGVRKQSERSGDIRVIDIEGFDRSPCGGTHVRRTGEIGLIAILGFERYKGGARVEFVCGGRALETLRHDHRTLSRLASLYSANPYDLPDLVPKWLQEKSDLTRQNARLQEELVALEANEMLANADKKSGIRIVRRNFSGRPAESLKLLAHKLVAHESTVAILAAAGETAQVVVARSANIPLDCGSVVRTLAARLGGKGGGRPEMAQAGGIPESVLEPWMAELEVAARSAGAPSG